MNITVALRIFQALYAILQQVLLCSLHSHWNLKLVFGWLLKVISTLIFEKKIWCLTRRLCFCLPSNYSGCGGTMTSLFGTFASPGYPSFYQNNERCVWNISVPSNFYIELIFGPFHLEACYDKVRIYDGPGELSLLATYVSRKK